MDNSGLNADVCNKDLRVNSLEDALKVVERYQVETGTAFSIAHKSSREFCADFILRGHAIQFEDRKSDVSQIKFDGVPFIITGSQTLECVYGHDRNKVAQKQQRKEEDASTTQSSRKVPKSKKIGCPAKIVLRDVIFFPDYKIDADGKYKRDKAKSKLKIDWAMKREDVNCERYVYIHLPIQTHVGHEANGSAQKVHKSILAQIELLATEHGVKKVCEMQQCVKTFVETELIAAGYSPEKSESFLSNRMYFPKKKDIANYLYRTTSKLKQSKIDHMNEDKITSVFESQELDDAANLKFIPSAGEQNNKKIVDRNRNIETSSDDEDQSSQEMAANSTLKLLLQEEGEKKNLKRKCDETGEAGDVGNFGKYVINELRSMDSEQKRCALKYHFKQLLVDLSHDEKQLEEISNVISSVPLYCDRNDPLKKDTESSVT